MRSVAWWRCSLRSGTRKGIQILVLLLLTVTPARHADAYSFLTHEQLIDLTWKSSIAPLLLSRYPHLTPQQMLEAHAYAYGGCLIQDIGYYPFGDAFFSDLTHYVRSGDFVSALFRDAQNADELAFAIGALSHYLGDTIGHPQATNRAVAVEFPKLQQKYGPVISFEQGEHPHVQTELAFDINEISKHRFAPSAYLRHIGLAVPTRLLALAYYQTYGLGTDYISGRHRPTLRGYRFAVRSLLPRVAYAENVLHRKSFPPDTPGPDLDLFKQELKQADFENGWEQYRKKAGIGTYALAGFIFVLPKVGALKLLAIKGPTPQTDIDYIRSVNESVVQLRRLLARFGSDQTLPNRDLDTGAKVRPGGYRLTDDTYAKLLHEITHNNGQPIPPALKQDILEYYADPAAPIYTKRNPKRWARVQAELKMLEVAATSREVPTLPTQPDLSPGATEPAPQPATR